LYKNLNKIRKEIEDELKKEDMKYKSRVSTVCGSPKSMINSMILKPSHETLLFEHENEHGGKRKSIK
jgi:hypothetical protein